MAEEKMYCGLKLFTCYSCGAEFVFLKSTTSGKPVPVEKHSFNGERVYLPEKHVNHIPICRAKTKAKMLESVVQHLTVVEPFSIDAVNQATDERRKVEYQWGEVFSLDESKRFYVGPDKDGFVWRVDSERLVVNGELTEKGKQYFYKGIKQQQLFEG